MQPLRNDAFQEHFSTRYESTKLEVSLYYIFETQKYAIGTTLHLRNGICLSKVLFRTHPSRKPHCLFPRGCRRENCIYDLGHTYGSSAL